VLLIYSPPRFATGTLTGSIAESSSLPDDEESSADTKFLSGVFPDNVRVDAIAAFDGSRTGRQAHLWNKNMTIRVVDRFWARIILRLVVEKKREKRKISR